MKINSSISAASVTDIINSINASGIKAALTIPRDTAVKVADEHIAAVGIDVVRQQKYLREVTFNRAGQLDDNDLLQVLKLAMQHTSGKLCGLRIMFDFPGSVMALGIEGGMAVVITADVPTLH